MSLTEEIPVNEASTLSSPRHFILCLSQHENRLLFPWETLGNSERSDLASYTCNTPVFAIRFVGTSEYSSSCTGWLTLSYFLMYEQLMLQHEIGQK